MCDVLLSHSRPQAILPAAKRARFRNAVPPHAPLASPSGTQGVRQGCLRTRRLLYHPALLPFTAPPNVHKLCSWSRLHGIWRRGSRCPAHLAGSHAQFDSATWFSSPGNLPSSTAFSRLRWKSRTPLLCARRLLSSWQRVQSSRSLQPRWGSGFTALTSSYPRKVVVTDQSWIGKSWTGLCTSPGRRCWRAGALSNTPSPRIGLQAIDLKDAYCHVSILLQHKYHWGDICNGQAASELRTGPRMLWYISCLELWALHLALWQFRPLLLGKHVLVRMDNNAVVSYINRLGGIRSRRMSQLARHLLLWSHTQLKSLRAAHIPGKLNRVADALSRQRTFPGEWRLHPETIGLIWSRFGEAQGDLFASHESSHCQLYFFPDRGPPQHGRTGTHLSSGFTQVCISPSEPTRTDTVQAQGGWGAGPPLSGARHHMAPASRSVEPPCVAPGWDAADLSGLPLAVVETITQARAPSTRQNYALNWCSSHREDPQRCTIGVVFSFLQERLERRLSPSTLKVYVAAIVAHHDAVDGQSLGKQDLILKGARRMNPSRSPLTPYWHLSIILAGLQRGPFGPLDSCQLRQRSWPRSLPSKGSGTSKHFR